jgi:hypothetical protein
MNRLCFIILLTFLTATSCYSQKQNTTILTGIGLSEKTELEKKTILNGQIDLLLPKDCKELRTEELKELDPISPPKYGFVNSDKSVLIEIRFSGKMTDGDVVTSDLNNNKELFETYFANNLNGLKYRHDIVSCNSKTYFIMDWDIDWNKHRIACFYFSTIYNGNFFIFDMKYPIEDRVKSEKLRQLILNSMKFKD